MYWALFDWYYEQVVLNARLCNHKEQNLALPSE